MNCHLTILLAQLVPESKSLRLLVCHREPKGTALELNLGEPRDRSLGTKEKFHFNPLSASFLWTFEFSSYVLTSADWLQSHELSTPGFFPSLHIALSHPLFLPLPPPSKEREKYLVLFFMCQGMGKEVLYLKLWSCFVLAPASQLSKSHPHS